MIISKSKQRKCKLVERLELSLRYISMISTKIRIEKVETDHIDERILSQWTMVIVKGSFSIASAHPALLVSLLIIPHNNLLFSYLI